MSYEHVEICADGIFITRWKSKTKEYIRKRVGKHSVLTHLRRRCDIAPGTTLKQIFQAVDRYKLLKLVIAQYSWCSPLEQFHEQIKEPLRRTDDQDQIDFLEVNWYCDVEKYEEKIKHPGGLRERIRAFDFELSPGFHGIGPSKREGEDNYGPGLTSYSVSYSPMYEFADTPVVLNPKFTAWEPFEPGRHNKDNRPQKVLEAERHFTLLQVLDAIYWDISFVGGPEQNAQFLDSIRERVDAINAGEVPMIPLEQVQKQLGLEQTPPEEGEMKILMHPDVAEAFGADPNAIPLDDKEFIEPKDIDN